MINAMMQIIFTKTTIPSFFIDINCFMPNRIVIAIEAMKIGIINKIYKNNIVKKIVNSLDGECPKFST